MLCNRRLGTRLLLAGAAVFLGCQTGTQEHKPPPAQANADKIFSGHVSVSFNGVAVAGEMTTPAHGTTPPLTLRVPLENGLNVSGELQLRTPGYLSFQLSNTSGVVVDSIGGFARPDSNGKAHFAQELRVQAPGEYVVTAYLIVQDERQIVFKRRIELYQP